jgi:hypothetical protein
MLLCVPCFGGSKQDETGSSNLEITVRVFNYAGASPETWELAQNIATRIFNRAGIETAWMVCSLTSEGQFLPPDCALPPQPTDIFLRLTPATRATRAQFGDALGIAAPSETGTRASACVFYNRVQELAKGGTAPVAVILGHVAAHEIGHLLLGRNSDSSRGAMCGRWSRSDLALASDGQLDFLQGEAARIQKEVFRRQYSTGQRIQAASNGAGMKPHVTDPGP